MLEPTSGTVLDLACGSGGMFVQSARIVEQHLQNPSERLTFRSYEKNKTSVNLNKMNLAIHGLEGDIQQNISYYDDPLNLLHKCDYVLANPPFNVDDCGILKNLRKALATFAGRGDEGHSGDDIELDRTRPDEELLDTLALGIQMVREFLTERGTSLDDIKTLTGFVRNAAIVKAKEAASENDESRKLFEIICRAVFSEYKVCFGDARQKDFRADRDAINVVYKSLQDNKQNADITVILQSLHAVIDEAITTRTQGNEDHAIYDISKINFERLRQEFQRTAAPNATMQNLLVVIEERLQRLIARNPLRTDFQGHYKQIVGEYNQKKNRDLVGQLKQEDCGQMSFAYSESWQQLPPIHQQDMLLPNRFARAVSTCANYAEVLMKLCSKSKDRRQLFVTKPIVSPAFSNRFRVKTKSRNVRPSHSPTRAPWD